MRTLLFCLPTGIDFRTLHIARDHLQAAAVVVPVNGDGFDNPARLGEPGQAK
jgi:hypothetical protein